MSAATTRDFVRRPVLGFQAFGVTGFASANVGNSGVIRVTPPH